MLGIDLPAFQVTEQNRPRASNHLPSRFTRDLNILLQIVKIGRNWEQIFGKQVGNLDKAWMPNGSYGECCNNCVCCNGDDVNVTPFEWKAFFASLGMDLPTNFLETYVPPFKL